MQFFRLVFHIKLICIAYFTSSCIANVRLLRQTRNLSGSWIQTPKMFTLIHFSVKQLNPVKTGIWLASWLAISSSFFFFFYWILLNSLLFPSIAAEIRHDDPDAFTKVSLSWANVLFVLKIPFLAIILLAIFLHKKHISISYYYTNICFAKLSLGFKRKQDRVV